MEITQRWHVLIPGTVCWCPLQWVDWSIIAQDCLTGEISLWLLQDKLPPLLGDTPWPDKIICMSSKAALSPHFSRAVTVHHGIPQADGLVMVGYNIGYPVLNTWFLCVRVGEVLDMLGKYASKRCISWPHFWCCTWQANTCDVQVSCCVHWGQGLYLRIHCQHGIEIFYIAQSAFPINFLFYYFCSFFTTNNSTTICNICTAASP